MENLSEFEKMILGSTMPVHVAESQEVSVLGERGVWTNREEVMKWKGSLPIEDYKINDSKDFETIVKKPSERINYIQKLAVRYLRPPTPNAPGDIIIEEKPAKMISPAPPLIIRQQALRLKTPSPLIIRERPPQKPKVSKQKTIMISGKRLPPPPRKVIIERMPAMPEKPKPVIIERWLPYEMPKRRVIFQKPPQPKIVASKPKNIIIQWEAPEVTIQHKLTNLGILKADPNDYRKMYGPTLKKTSELPSIAHEVPVPPGLTLAADYKPTALRLSGDLEALKLINLDEHGLSEYKPQLESTGNSWMDSSSSLTTVIPAK